MNGSRGDDLWGPHTLEIKEKENKINHGKISFGRNRDLATNLHCKLPLEIQSFDWFICAVILLYKEIFVWGIHRLLYYVRKNRKNERYYNEVCNLEKGYFLSVYWFLEYLLGTIEYKIFYYSGLLCYSWVRSFCFLFRNVKIFVSLLFFLFLLITVYGCYIIIFLLLSWILFV